LEKRANKTKSQEKANVRERLRGITSEGYVRENIERGEEVNRYEGGSEDGF
jgi:hypothetical protein